MTAFSKVAVYTFILTNKLKILLVTCALLLFVMGLHGIPTEDHSNSQSMKTNDPFVTDIQKRADLVSNAVNEAIDQQGKQSPLQYKQTCENSLSYIQKERLDTNYNYNSLSPEHKEVINEYRGFLKDAGNVVVVSSQGKNADLTAMNNAKKALI
jgi:hypothetical protein